MEIYSTHPTARKSVLVAKISLVDGKFSYTPDELVVNRHVEKFSNFENRYSASGDLSVEEAYMIKIYTSLISSSYMGAKLEPEDTWYSEDNEKKYFESLP